MPKNLNDVVKQHQIKIAKKTLKMPSAMLGVMGGMNKKEAEELLEKQEKEACHDS